MAYLNTEYIHSKKMTLYDVVILQLIKQNKIEDQGQNIALYLQDGQLEKLREGGFLTEVKQKKKDDNDFRRLRTTKKANDFLDNTGTPEITEGDVYMFNYLCEMYLSHEDTDRVIGNKKKVKMYCAIFRNTVNLTLHQMYWLCYMFLEEYHWTKKLENIFFDSNKNRYGTFKNNIDDSPLYQFLEENRDRVQRLWEQKNAL